MIITIDGPGGSGKSTVARLLAQKLGCYYINTGLLFRALAYLLITKYKYTKEQLEHPDYVDIQKCLDKNNLVYKYEQGEAFVFCAGQDVTMRVKHSDMSESASFLALNPDVQNEMIKFQQMLAKGFHIVSEGRNIGTAVFPDALAKFYLTASVQVRAARICGFENQKGNILEKELAEKLVMERDHRDKTRQHFPLLQPVDALVIDSSFLTPVQVIEIMLDHINSLKKK